MLRNIWNKVIKNYLRNLMIQVSIRGNEALLMKHKKKLDIL